MVSNNRSRCAGDPPMTADSPLGIKQLIPLLEAAAKLPGKGPLATVAMLVVSSLRWRRLDHLLLTPRTLSEFGLGRGTAYRSLVQLEQLGLVTVRRRKGQGPLVSFAIPAGAEGPQEAG